MPNSITVLGASLCLKRLLEFVSVVSLLGISSSSLLNDTLQCSEGSEASESSVWRHGDIQET